MNDGIFINQSKYIKEMLKKFGLEDSKPTKTSMSMEIKLTKDDEADSVDSTKYQGKLSKTKEKRMAPPSYSSFLSSNKDEEPSFLQFYEELSDYEDLADAQKEKKMNV
ncbi:hypothetical protein Tco_0167215 [Tanacetum coccineum]